MTQQFKCKACGAVYTDTQRDGTTYHHACPAVEPIDGKPAKPMPRRDENIALARGGAVTGIISEGQGVVCITDPKLTEPAWITKLKASLPKEDDD